MNFRQLSVVLLAVIEPSGAVQFVDTPNGMYCGGNLLVDEGRIEAASLDLSIVDPVGSVLPHARVQVQKRGSDVILLDKNAN